VVWPPPVRPSPWCCWPVFGGRALALGLVQGVLCIAAFASWLITFRPGEVARSG
jgi:hypothetical protein